MTAIADSCALIVFLQEQDPQAKMPNAYPYMVSREVYVPPLVVWEISLKIGSGKLPPLSIKPSALLRQLGFNFLPMTWEVAEMAGNLPPIHRDPIDRILVAHSMIQNMPVLTSDRIIPSYGVATIW
jgi:PIN domain nuclease of toxin-antitoxin system